jgi:hypothetical protein
MRTLTCAVLLAAVGLSATAGTDVTGKWTGTASSTTAEGQTRDGTAVLNLKQTGAEITGSVGPTDDNQHTITKGTIDGDRITLEVVDAQLTIKFNLTLAGDRIAGDAVITDEGVNLKGKIDVKRAK